MFHFLQYFGKLYFFLTGQVLCFSVLINNIIYVVYTISIVYYICIIVYVCEMNLGTKCLYEANTHIYLYLCLLHIYIFMIIFYKLYCILSCFVTILSFILIVSIVFANVPNRITILSFGVS